MVKRVCGSGLNENAIELLLRGTRFRLPTKLISFVKNQNDFKLTQLSLSKGGWEVQGLLQRQFILEYQSEDRKSIILLKRGRKWTHLPSGPK